MICAPLRTCVCSYTVFLNTNIFFHIFTLKSLLAAKKLCLFVPGNWILKDIRLLKDKLWADETVRKLKLLFILFNFLGGGGIHYSLPWNLFNWDLHQKLSTTFYFYKFCEKVLKNCFSLFWYKHFPNLRCELKLLKRDCLPLKKLSNIVYNVHKKHSLIITTNIIYQSK